jgi:hypothetical protein
MTAAERAEKSQALINEVIRIPDIGYGNYKAELKQYRRILMDLLVLIRDDALAEAALASKSTHES